MTCACPEARAALEMDPLNLAPDVEAHLAVCPACAEARVLWLALAEAPDVVAPAGYFDTLPDRVLRKLPPRPVGLRRFPMLAAAAAVLLMLAAAGGFWAGRIQRQPLVEANLAAPAAEAQLPEETPFYESEDDLARLEKLKPEQAEAVLASLASKPRKGGAR